MSPSCLRRSLGKTRTIPPVRRSHCRMPTLDDAKRLKVGYFEDDGLMPVTPETRKAVQNAAGALRNAGFDVRPFRPRRSNRHASSGRLFFLRCGAMFEEPLVRGHEDKLSPVFRDFLARAHAAGPLTAERVARPPGPRPTSSATNCWRRCRSFPCCLCPVASVPAFRHDERSWTIDGQQVEYLDAMRYSQWFNLLAAPAAVVPVGRSPEGLPIGVQIVGRPFEDEVVLRVASVLDHSFGYVPPPISNPL